VTLQSAFQYPERPQRVVAAKSEDAIRSGLRRSRDAIQAVSDAVAEDGHDAVPDLVPDAVARALDALYDLAEVVKKQGGHSLKNSTTLPTVMLPVRRH
jgi:hypothetical protein